MDFFRNRYYNINRLTLSFVGLWPYQNLYRRLASVAFSTVIFGTIMLLTISKIIRTHITTLLLVYCLQFVVPSLLLITNCVYCFFNADKMKMLLEHIKRDWSLFQPCDTEIIQPYAEYGRIFNLAITVFSVFIAAVPLLQTSKRSNLDSHSNDTDIIEVLIPMHISDTRYDKCFIYFICLLFVIFALALLIAVAFVALYFSSIQHACGIFSIAGRRLETMFDDVRYDICVYENKVILEVFRSVMFHTRAIGFLYIVNSFYGPLYIAKMSILIMLLSIELFQVTSVYDTHDLRNNFVSFGHFLSVFVITAMFCYTGQILLDHSNGVFEKVYSSQWYMAPLSMQKLMLTVMIRCLKASGLTLTHSVTVSLEMLATMLQMSVSYFMAIRSLQE